MTGLLGKGARWFFGFSKLPIDKDEPTDTWVSSDEYNKLVTEHNALKEKLEEAKTKLTLADRRLAYISVLSSCNNLTDLSRLKAVSGGYSSNPSEVVVSLVEELLELRVAKNQLEEKLSTSPNYVIGQQYIVCAAARNNFTGQIICSPRHYDRTFHQSVVDRSTAWNVADQGFVDQYGNFLTRAEAHKIAVAAGQIRRRCGGDHEELYSENLY